MRNEREVLKACWQRTDACPELPSLLDGIQRGDTTVTAHVDDCPHCAAELALYRDVVDGPTLANADVNALNQRISSVVTGRAPRAVRLESWWSRLFRPVVLAPAMAAMAIVLVLVGIRVRQNPTPGSYGAIERSQAVEMLSPKGELTAPPDVLRWAAVTGAASYKIRILEIDRNVIWEATSTTTSTPVPASVQKRALPGKRLIWTVEAFNSKGENVANGRQDFRRAIVRQGAH